MDDSNVHTHQGVSDVNPRQTGQTRRWRRPVRQRHSQEIANVLRDLARKAEQELMGVQMASMDELTLLSNRHGFERFGPARAGGLSAAGQTRDAAVLRPR